MGIRSFLLGKFRKKRINQIAPGGSNHFNSMLLDPRIIEKERVTHLEEVKQLASRFLSENKTIKDTHKAAWEYDVVENNIQQLTHLIRNFNKLLSKQSLIEFVKETVQQQLQLMDQRVILARPDILNSIRRFTYIADRVDVLRYCPSYSIIYDLHWITCGIIGEQNDIALGKASPDIFEKYCPELVSDISAKLIPYLKHRGGYELSTKLLEEVSANFPRNSFLLNNILLITITEGVVRELAAFVYGMQNRSLSPYEVDQYVNGKFLSLEGLISRADWKEDLPMSILEAYVLSKCVDDKSLEKATSLVGKHKEANDVIKIKLVEIHTAMKKASQDEDVGMLSARIEAIAHEMKEIGKNMLNPRTDSINVSLRTKLCFLLRRYKEDRNSIIHGQYTNFDKGWKSLIYLSALMKVFDVIKEYDAHYQKGK